MEAEIEFVARALYNAEDDAQDWDRESNIIRTSFVFMPAQPWNCLQRSASQRRSTQRSVYFPMLPEVHHHARCMNPLCSTVRTLFDNY